MRRTQKNKKKNLADAALDRFEEFATRAAGNVVRRG